jgi:hypothetical protein
VHTFHKHIVSNNLKKMVCHDKYLNAVQGRDISVRDATSKGRNIWDFSVGDTSSTATHYTTTNRVSFAFCVFHKNNKKCVFLFIKNIFLTKFFKTIWQDMSSTSKQPLVNSYKFTFKNISHMTLQHTEYTKNICLFFRQ